MDMRKINEEVDNFDLDSIDIANIEITELELQKIRKRANRNCKVSKKRKVNVAAAVVGTVIVGGAFTPVIAKNIPEVREVFYELGIFKEDFKEYTEYIGEKQTTEFGEVTLENLIVTDNTVLVSMEHKSEKPIDYDLNYLVISMPDTDGYISDGGEIVRKKIDDNTVVVTKEFQLIGGSLAKNKKMFMELVLLSKGSENQEEGTTVYAESDKSMAKFEIKSEFKSALKNREVIELNINIGDENSKTKEMVKSLESNVLCTSIYTEELDEAEMKIDFKLRVDGKEYTCTGPSGFREHGSKIVKREYRFKDVKVDNIRDAKSVGLVMNGEILKIK